MNIESKNSLKIILSLLLFTMHISCVKKEESNKDAQFLCCTDHPKSNENTDNLDSIESTYVSPIVTPNGDGINDYLFINNINLFLNNTLTIYDMENNLVFKKTGYNNMNNVFTGKNQDSLLEYPTGSYQYILVIENEDTFIENGFLCLIRTESKEQNKNNCNGLDANDPLF